VVPLLDAGPQSVLQSVSLNASPVLLSAVCCLLSRVCCLLSAICFLQQGTERAENATSVQDTITGPFFQPAVLLHFVERV
jgi:hypothetical protein